MTVVRQKEVQGFDAGRGDVGLAVKRAGHDDEFAAPKTHQHARERLVPLAPLDHVVGMKTATKFTGAIRCARVLAAKQAIQRLPVRIGHGQYLFVKELARNPEYLLVGFFLGVRGAIKPAVRQALINDKRIRPFQEHGERG